MFSSDPQDADKVAFFEQIAAKYRETLEKIDAAARRSGRTGKDVLLVAVSKYASPNDGIVEGFLRAGAFDLAENRPQRFLEKVEYWNNTPVGKVDQNRRFVPARERVDSLKTINWHFIGNLQRNKARRILPYVTLIHSVDSWKLAEALDRILEEEAERPGEVAFPKSVSVLLEVHISGDETKQGFTAEEVLDVLPKIVELKHIKPLGLMGMAGLTAAPDEIRRQFASLRETLERCRKLAPELSDFKELSMGMSGDFEIAVEEGATIVRVGSSLYPNRS